MSPQEMVANAMLDRNMQAKRLGIPQQMGAFANSLGMVPTPEQEAVQDPLIAPETYGVGSLLKKMAPMLPGALGMTVYHGSPHAFDKFSMSKIGTGEGAQAYGHGLYFTEQPHIAKYYQDKLSVEEGLLKDKYAHLPSGESRQIGHHAMVLKSYQQGKMSKEEALESLNMDIRGAKYIDNKESLEKAEFAKKALESGDFTLSGVNFGNLYHVDLPDDSIAKMLDWDKPLSQQPENVRKSLEPILEELRAAGRMDKNGPVRKAWENPTGETLITSLEHYLGGQANASRKLREAGIPGIKYLDGGSRTAGKGSSNYVVFDEALPKIMKRE